MQVARTLLIGALCLPSLAQAAPFWDRPRRTAYSLGISLLVNLGPSQDRKRFGVALDANSEWIWQERPYWYDGPNQLTPVVRISTQIGWTQPVVHTQLTAQLGTMYPLAVYDGGYIRGPGLLGGGGLGMATDGSAGPLVTGTLVAPWLEGRVEATQWDGGWHAPRLSTGLQMPMNCCNTYF